MLNKISCRYLDMFSIFFILNRTVCMTRCVYKFFVLTFPQLMDWGFFVLFFVFFHIITVDIKDQHEKTIVLAFKTCSQ